MGGVDGGLMDGGWWRVVDGWCGWRVNGVLGMYNLVLGVERKAKENGSVFA